MTIAAGIVLCLTGALFSLAVLLCVVGQLA